MKRIKLVWIGLLLFACMAAGIYKWNDIKAERALAEDLSHKVLRFHILANSDSTEDQQQKLYVRDEIGTYMQEVLDGSESLAQAEDAVRQNIDSITAYAKEAVAESGSDYGVRVSLERTRFPVKTYGDFTFPAGVYEAMVVRIGEAKGHNWWCVMYPNLCFTDGVYEEPEDDAQADNELRAVIGDEDYQAVKKGEGLQIRFKYLTFLNEWFE